MNGESPPEVPIERWEHLPHDPAKRSEKQTAESEHTIEFSPKDGMSDSSAGTTQPVVSVASNRADLLKSMTQEGIRGDPRYAIDRLYAEGGIGRVWLARDTQLNRVVALKTLKPELLWSRRGAI
ncbi:MAG: hypothetical protein JW829_02130 [Pirellulales bacterium]|nr:hypothetical protein [Pirellulales bacterium]